MLSPRFGCSFHLSSCWHRAKRLSSVFPLRATPASNFDPPTRFKLTPDQRRTIVSSLSSFRTVSTSHFGSLSSEQDVKSSLQDAKLQPLTPTQAAQSEGMMNLSVKERKIIALLKFNPQVERKQYPKNEGIIMGSEFAKQVISSMENPASDAIRGVPMDERESCRMKLIESLSKPKDSKGVLLLCNCGYRGCGKSTLQAMNMKWFVENTQGIGIFLTYNEDQTINLATTGNMYACNGHEFKQTVALRILHRMMAYHLGDIEMANELFDDGRIAKAVAGLSDPILSALNIVKKMLGAPADTKILLCVDETKMAVDGKFFRTTEALRVLCSQYLDEYPWLYLSVSVYGAISLADYATGSSRNLLLQYLPPIDVTLGLDETKIHLLPVMLQPFYDANMRKLLPYKTTTVKKIDPIKLYTRISEWLILTCGHGRRVEYLFQELRNFNVLGSLNSSKPYPWIESEEEGEAFVEQLSQWLHTYNENRIIAAMEKVSDFPSDLPVGDMESLAVNAVSPFMVKNDDADVNITLNAVESGICSLLEHQEMDQTLAFIPAPILHSLFGAELEEYGPCGQALFQLSKELRSLPRANTNHYREKCYERVMSRALLHYTRGNDCFSPKVFCLNEHAGKAFRNIKLLGNRVEYKEIAAFPPKGCRNLTIAEVEEFICHNLPSNANGAIVVPLEKFNLVGDYFYGIFRRSDSSKRNPRHIVLLVFQNKYWFGDWANDNDNKPIHIIDSWRKFREIFPKDPITVKDNNGHQTVVEFLHILQTANPIDAKAYNEYFKKDFKCEENEGIGSIPQMRDWHPTAAYACETAVTMNKQFRSNSNNTETI